MTVMSIARFERFFRAAAGLDVDKNDLKRYSDFVDAKLYDLLTVAQATAKANGRDVIRTCDLPITKGLQESIHHFRKIDQQVELKPILEQIATHPALDRTPDEETEAAYPDIVGGLSPALAQNYARAFDREDQADMGRRAPLHLLPLRLLRTWRMRRRKEAGGEAGTASPPP